MWFKRKSSKHRKHEEHKPLKEFFIDSSTGKYSMGRLTTFTVTLTLCIEALISSLFLGGWNFSLYKALWGLAALGSKSAEKALTVLKHKWDNMIKKFNAPDPCPDDKGHEENKDNIKEEWIGKI